MRGIGCVISWCDSGHQSLVLCPWRDGRLFGPYSLLVLLIFLAHLIFGFAKNHTVGREELQLGEAGISHRL